MLLAVVVDVTNSTGIHTPSMLVPVVMTARLSKFQYLKRGPPPTMAKVSASVTNAGVFSCRFDS